MRLFYETIEWRIIAIIITFAVTYIWTGKVLESGVFALVLQGIKAVVFYFWLKYREPKLRTDK